MTVQLRAMNDSKPAPRVQPVRTVDVDPAVQVEKLDEQSRFPPGLAKKAVVVVEAAVLP